MDADARTGRLNMPLLLGLLAIVIGIGLLWNFPIIRPLKLFVVFLHEASHAFAAHVTGGEVLRIDLLFNEGGAAYTRGGSPFWTLNAGYLGSMLWGGIILILATRTRLTRVLAVTIGAAVLLLTLRYVRTWSGVSFGVLFGGAMIAGGILLRKGIVTWFLRTVGLMSCLYALYDIASDVLLRPEAPSDARMLATTTGFPPFLSPTYATLFWGVLWMGISLLVTVVILAVAAGGRPSSSNGT